MLQPALRDGVAREVQVSCDGDGVLLRAPQMFELHVPFLSFLGERWAGGFVVPSLTPFQLLQQDDEVQEAHKVMVCVGAVVQLLERELRLEEPELVSVSRLSQGRQQSGNASLHLVVQLQATREDVCEPTLFIELIPGQNPIVQLRKALRTSAYRPERHNLAPHESTSTGTPLRTVSDENRIIKNTTRTSTITRPAFPSPCAHRRRSTSWTVSCASASAKCSATRSALQT